MLALCNDCNAEDHEEDDATDVTAAGTNATTTPVRSQRNATMVQTPPSRSAVMSSLIASLQPRTPVAMNLSKSNDGAEQNGLFCEGTFSLF